MNIANYQKTDGFDFQIPITCPTMTKRNLHL